MEHETINSDNSYFPIIVRTEYTMKTKKFWATVKVMVGFISAVSILLWLFRAYKWQIRNKIEVVEPKNHNGNIALVLDMAMLMLHTFVIVFFPFIFTISLYW